MDKQTLHGIGWSKEQTLEIQEGGGGIELTIFGPRRGIQGMILVDKKEFEEALITMREQLDELPF